MYQFTSVLGNPDVAAGVTARVKAFSDVPIYLCPRRNTDVAASVTTHIKTFSDVPIYLCPR